MNDTLILLIALCALMLTTVYLVLHRMLQADRQRRQAEMLIGARQETIRLRLRAIEQLVVFVEQLSPMHLSVRTTNAAADVMGLMVLLQSTVHNDFIDILPQQLYVGMDTWRLIIDARNAATAYIVRVGSTLPPDGTAMTLSSKLIDSLTKDDFRQTTAAMDALRKEAQILFG